MPLRHGSLHSLGALRPFFTGLITLNCAYLCPTMSSYPRIGARIGQDLRSVSLQGIRINYLSKHILIPRNWVFSYKVNAL